jgi:hypothetical protein
MELRHPTLVAFVGRGIVDVGVTHEHVKLEVHRVLSAQECAGAL